MADIKRGSPDQPIALWTIFGWAISGRYKSDPEHYSSHSAQVCHLASAPSSDELLKRFWETEEVFFPCHCFTPEERSVIDHFQTHHSYLPEGRFRFSPCKPNHPPLGESRTWATLNPCLPLTSPTSTSPYPCMQYSKKQALPPS